MVCGYKSSRETLLAVTHCCFVAIPSVLACCFDRFQDSINGPAVAGPDRRSAQGTFVHQLGNAGRASYITIFTL
ncbi:hypothetical protein ACOSQ3_026682 [Xanthoceras sorbifolium]